MAKSRTSGGHEGGEAVIGSSTRVRGRVFGDGDVRVEGSLEGDIAIQGDLVIGNAGKARSNVEARAVTIGGQLDGDVRAQGVVHIESGARVHGDVHSQSVAIDDGAEFDGQLLAEFDLPIELGGGASASGGRRR